jgi:ABC-type proline/glycine betaine transport system permease subunit
VQVVATAALGPLVGYKDLGTPIIIGFTSPDKGSMLAGAFVVIMLALVTDRAFALATWWLVPWRYAPRRTADATVVAEEAVPA